ncbi:MAG TPA: hypothetical protein VG692_04575 [Gemmatimonadales bacterium]|nr:hypothetical protein [Gemmatimonadales bacterium]
MTRRWLPVLLLAAACGGGSPGSAAPNENATTADGAVRQFLQAVADSNIARMARYWGGSKGPAGITGQPADYLQRMTVTQAFLRQSPYRVVAMNPIDKNRMVVTTEFTRGATTSTICKKNMDIEVRDLGAKYGWVVTSMDLNQVGAPSKPC